MQAFVPTAAAQSMADALAYREVRKIVEVRVHRRSTPGGRGWAITVDEENTQYCYVVTPFHVIGDEITRTLYGDVVVRGAGYKLGPPAYHLADDGRDLALLLVDREGQCPFAEGLSAGRVASGLWLARLSDRNVREEIAGDVGAPIVPESENLDIASLTVVAADQDAVAAGWSGATVFRDGRRIGMVIEAADDGATARFYTAQGIFRAFRDQIAIFERRVGKEKEVAGTPPSGFVAAGSWLDRVGDVLREEGCAECPELVVVSPGTFMRGAPDGEPGRTDDEGPWRRVDIGKPFAVGRYEVTRDQFDAFVRATGHSVGSRCWTYEAGEWKNRLGLSYLNPGYSQSGDHPVVCVSWDDAKAYADWLSSKTGHRYRLLSEAEWEYVARAGSQWRFSFGDQSEKLCRYGNGADLSTDFSWRNESCNDGHARTSRVGSFDANGFMVYDMHGNVWEWTEDCWNDSYAGSPNDGSARASGACDRRVLRGGSWYSRPGFLRSANRDADTSDNRVDSDGFRIARTLTP